MSKIPDRFKGHVAANIYSSKTGKVVKEYLEKEALKDWAEATKGVDGAESAEVVAAGHSGGTVPTEPFHLDIVVKDGGGKNIQTKNPHTNKPTNTGMHTLARTRKTSTPRRMPGRRVTWELNIWHSSILRVLDQSSQLDISFSLYFS